MPHFIISRMIILKLIRFIKADTAFYTLFKSVFSFLPPLIKNVGIIPVAVAMWNISTFISKSLKLKDFPLEVLNKLNPLVVKTIIEAIAPNWDTCIKNSGLFKNLFNFFLGLFSLGLIRPIIFKCVKFTFGIVFTSIGIAFNEALSSITFLKTISDYILNFIPITPAINNFISLFKGQVNTTDISVNKSDINQSINETSSILSIIGLIILGAGTILIVLFTGDYFISSTIRTIPGVGTILDSLYSAGNYLLSWFQSTPKPDIDPSTPESIKLDDIRSESISRSSSGSSTASDTTFKQPTPPASRPTSPTMWPNPRDPRDSSSNWD